MHAYQACGYVGFATGQSFGGCFCPPNFDPVARARIQQARYLWKHEPNETMERAANYVANMKLPLELAPEEFHTVAQANLDSLNTGVYEDCEQFHPFTSTSCSKNRGKHLLATLSPAISRSRAAPRMRPDMG